MSALDTAMTYFPYVFHPITVLGAGILLLIHSEWELQDADRATLWRRVGAFLGAGVLALVPTVTYFAITGSKVVESTRGNAFVMDALVASGLFIAAAVTGYMWWSYDWGTLVLNAMETLAVVTVPYIALSPFWNVSGHVIISLMPTLYLTLADRKFWPLLLVPIVMVPNRVYLDAHTVEQSVAGFLVAGVITAGMYWLHVDRSLRPGAEASAT